MDSGNINKQLDEYVESKLFPIYNTFDKAHNENHIKDVIRRSLAIYEYALSAGKVCQNEIFETSNIVKTKQKTNVCENKAQVCNINECEIEKLNINIIYAVASFHDIGLIKGRQGHANVSKEYVLNDEFLKTIFSIDEINLIADAVQDHSHSKGTTPRSIYGKIIADADKDNNASSSLKRMWDFTQHHFPNWTKKERLDNVYEYFYSKYGPNGSVKYYLLEPKTSAFYYEMKQLAKSKRLFIEKFKEVEKQLNNVVF